MQNGLHRLQVFIVLVMDFVFINCVGRTSNRITNTAVIGCFDIGSSATQTFNSFPDCAFLVLLSENVFLQVLSYC